MPIGEFEKTCPSQENILFKNSEQGQIVVTVCPGSSDPFYIVTYYIKWVTTSTTHSIT